jgi:predicted DNA-binding transcriptional regulator YafY
MGAPGRPGEADLLRQLRRAIVGRHTARFRYHARHSQDGPSAWSKREADPYGLVHVFGAWILAAYCHLRQDIRYFRIDRMDQLTVLSRTFTRPPDFTLEQRKDSDQRRIVVRALFESEVADWVREARPFYIVGEERRADGLLVTLRVRHEGEIIQWLLSWGASVRVLEPESLRRRLATEAERMLRNHGNSESLLT